MEYVNLFIKFWRWLTSLSKPMIAASCFALAVIGCLSFAVWMLLRIERTSDNTDVKVQIAGVKREIAVRDSVNFARLNDSISGISAAVRGHTRDISDIILIVAANSNSDLIRRLQPYLDGVATKQDIYRFVMELEKQEARKRDYSIDAKKKER